VSLDGLNALGLVYFKGNIWAGNTKMSLASILMTELINSREMLYRWFSVERREDSWLNLLI
jgi:hypothetical protein